MNSRDNPLATEYDNMLDKHAKARLLARVAKLLEYDKDDLDSVAFEQNFRTAKREYEELKE